VVRSYPAAFAIRKRFRRVIDAATDSRYFEHTRVIRGKGVQAMMKSSMAASVATVAAPPAMRKVTAPMAVRRIVPR
jgi:hypothetical protein